MPFAKWCKAGLTLNRSDLFEITSLRRPDDRVYQCRSRPAKVNVHGVLRLDAIGARRASVTLRRPRQATEVRRRQSVPWGGNAVAMVVERLPE